MKNRSRITWPEMKYIENLGIRDSINAIILPAMNCKLKWFRFCQWLKKTLFFEMVHNWICKNCYFESVFEILKSMFSLKKHLNFYKMSRLAYLLCLWKLIVNMFRWPLSDFRESTCIKTFFKSLNINRARRVIQN